MPVHYSVDPSTRVIHTVCEGQVDMAMVVAHLEELVKDDSLAHRLHLLLDLANCDTAPSGDQVRIVSERVTATRSDIEWGRCAILVSRDVLYGLGRMFEVHTHGVFQASHVFRDAEEARAWLLSPESDR